MNIVVPEEVESRGRHRRAARPARQIVDALVTVARRLPRAPEAGAHPPDPVHRVRRRPGRLGARRGARVRLARCSRARRCASRARTRGAARSASATACSSTPTPRRSTARSGTSTPTQAPFMIYDSVLSEFAALGFEYGYSVVRPRRAGRAGRRSSATSSTARRRSSTSSSSPPRTSGASSQRPRAAAPPRLRGPGPGALAARASNGSSRCARRTTCGSCYPTTAAQYFHVLRRQMHDAVAQAARVLHAEAVPAHAGHALARRRVRARQLPARSSTTRGCPSRRPRSGGRCSAPARSATSCIDRRDQLGAPVAVVRVEQLYPWPERQLIELAEKYTDVPPGVVGAGGAGEHGRLELRARQAAPHPAGPGRAAAHRPPAVAVPGERELRGPRPRAGAAVPRRVRRPAPAGTPRSASARMRSTSGDEVVLAGRLDRSRTPG